jgi:hypothetical protein
MQPNTVTALAGGKRAYKAHSGPDTILGVLSECTAAEYENGRLWYRRANRFARKLAALAGKKPETVAAVLARLSPQVSWADNKAAALEVCCGTEYEAANRCYPDNVLRAEALASEDSEAEIAKQVLPQKGYKRPKISAFYRNISAPEDPQAVTVDTWAARIWIGDCEAPALRISQAESERIQADYREAAAIAGLLPQELQAVVWIGAHRIAKERGQRNLFEIGLSFKI